MFAPVHTEYYPAASMWSRDYPNVYDALDDSQIVIYTQDKQLGA